MTRKVIPPPRVPISDDDAYFVHKVKARCIEDGDCQIWPGAVSRNVLPQVYFKGGTRYVRKVLWELYFGPVPQGHGVVTNCTSKRCVEVTHLATMTRKASLKLAAKKGQAGLPARIAKMVSTLRSKSIYDESVIQIVLAADTVKEAARLTGMSKSHASGIRRGESRRPASNPFSGLMTRVAREQEASHV